MYGYGDALRAISIDENVMAAGNVIEDKAAAQQYTRDLLTGARRQSWHIY